MRVFVYEYTCGGGMAGDCRSSCLWAEGWAMLTAVLADFARVNGTEVVTLLDEHSEAPRDGRILQRVRRGEEEQAFRQAARAADFTLVVAPEFDDLLATRCRWAEQEGSRLLGSAPRAVQLTADKLELGRHLRHRGVSTPESWRFLPGQPLPSVPFPAVCKPRHGAGSSATWFIQHPRQLKEVQASGWTDQFLLQPFIPGLPASVAFLLGAGQQMPLLPATQRFSDDGRFHYLGGRVPLPRQLGERACRLAWQAVQTVPGLQGYVGVDLILGPAGDGSQDVVVEINPRLTTSYVGLRALAETNLAEAMLCIVTGREVLPLRWRTGSVLFQADGRVAILDD